LTLALGVRLGPYEIVSPLGAGGMGEVYRARDTKLDRDVAIKILPDVFGADSERRARFAREAKTLASLNHPNIAAIYGLEDGSGMSALVLELVEGPTLADRIAQGAIPLEEALPIARQIAEALEAAHELGIIHRDLKPANVKLRPDGTVKVLDFGLAKVLEPTTVASGDAAASPTITSPAMTEKGIILGTAAYMSPEQAKGRPADKRSDVWAFGALLFEMLSGRRAFKGDGINDTLAAVLRADPSWTDLPPGTATAIRRLLYRCLQRDPKRRWQHIGDVRLELTEVEYGEPETPAVAVSRSRRLVWPLVAAMAAGAAVASFAAWMLAPQPPALRVNRFTIQIPASAPLMARGGGLALSPDGSTLVYVAGTRPGLVARRLNDQAAEPVRGGEGGVGPFYSPDGAWIGFFADGKLKKVPAGGGLAETICDAPPGARGTWGDDNTIVVARTNLYKVSANGGSLDLILEAGDAQFSFPEFLPGSRAVLVQTRLPPTVGHVEAIDLQTRSRHTLIEGSTPKLAATGDLLFARQGRLWATKFDRTRLEVVGTPVPLVEQLGDGFDGQAMYTVSTDGSLAYIPGAGSTIGSMAWLDRTGKATPALDDQLGFLWPRLSPDGRRVAVSVTREDGLDLWAFDLERGSRQKLTTDGNNRRTVWSPDGKQIAFFSLPVRPKPGESQDLFVVPSTGGPATRLLARPGPQWPDAWSPPDGRFLVFEEGGGVSRDLWVLPFGDGKDPYPLVTTKSNERGAVFSPDGRSLAFVSDESNRPEVYVLPFPASGQKVAVSTKGGLQPVWSRDGRELFYREGDSLMAVDVQVNPLRVGLSHKLFDLPVGIYGADQFLAEYDVAPDGRFLAIRRNAADQIQIILNWTEELRRRVLSP
jgi:eukaryotic-like serine/threonine-protein kinase